MAASISTPSRLFLSYSKSPSNIHSPIRSIRFPRFPVAAMSVEAPQKSAAQSAFLDSKQSSLLHFVKYQGLGNDFILVDNRDTSEPRVTPEQAVKLCDRNFGVGADGVIFVMPGVGGTDYTMRIFNSDGSEPEMCGNGVRCFARFIAELEKLHGTQGEISCFVPTIKEEPPDVLLVCPDVDPQILPCAGLGNMHPRFGVGYEKLLWFLDAARTHPDELYTVGDYGYLGTTVTTILPCAGLGNMNPRFGVGYEKLLWFLDAAQTHPDELYTVGDYGYLGTTVTTVDNFGDAGSPPLNYIDGIQARSSYLTVGGGLGINHYNGGIIPPTLINLNNTACDFVPSQGGPLIIEHTNRIFRRISSHQILWISLLMAGSLFFFNPSIRSIIKIIISFIHSSDGNYINLDALMSLMQFFGLRRQSSAALFCSVGIASETRKSPFKLMSMMMEVAWFLLGSFKGSKHDLVNSALDLVKEKFATQKIPPPNNLLQLKFSLDFVTSGGGCTQISLFMVAIFLVGILFTVLVESSKKKTMDESSLDAFTHIYDTDQHPKLCAEIPKPSKLRDRVRFFVKTKAYIQAHGEGKYDDQLRVLFDPTYLRRESELLIVTCKVRAKDKDEYKESMSHLRLIVEGVIKDAQVFHGETWPVQVFHGETWPVQPFV